MEVYLNETESRYFADLFLCCDVEKSGKIPMLKAMELYRSANLPNDVISEITALASIPATALHISRGQFYSCLKLVAAYQAGMPLREEIIAASLQLPLPRFSWKDSPNNIELNAVAEVSIAHQPNNGLSVIPPPTAAEWKNSLPRRPTDWHVGSTVAGSRRNSTVQQQHFQNQQESSANSDVLSTDSEVEQNESSCGDGGGRVIDTESSSREARRRGSPEAWSTNSDSPTPTNSVAERQWVKESLWQGLLGDEHRQLLGTEEESSDRHSSDDDNETDLDSIYQITSEQRDYYYKQFKAVQHDVNGLLSGLVARVFFEKSRIPVEELRHIWQLCDVTRDGALSLAEFTAAMHLVVLRRNNIPLPAVLPACLHPTVLQHGVQQVAQAVLPQEPPEADLLHLNDDDEEDNTDNTVIVDNKTTAVRIVNDKNIMNISTLSTSSQASTGCRQGNQSSLTPPPLPPPLKNRSISTSPSADPNSATPNLPNATALGKAKDRNLWGATDVPPTQWTKFTESPTTNLSSPGPKPVNFDMQRTAQAVVSDPQILHPVPLRVTPVAGSASANTSATTETLNQDVHDTSNQRDPSPKPISAIPTNTVGASTNSNSSSSSNLVIHNRESLQNSDLRAIQRPQAKKLPTKNIGALPPPPQRESSIGSASSGGGSGTTTSFSKAVGNGDGNELLNGLQQQQQLLQSKKDPPPLPPPRPHRHGRSSSLDLNKFKMSAPVAQQPEMIAQASFDLQTSTGFADFTHFSGDDAKDTTAEQEQHSLPPIQSLVSAKTVATAVAMPPTRFSLQQSDQRVSAFEVYRKPHTPRSSQSPIATAPLSLDSEPQQAHYYQQQNTYHPNQPTQPPPPAPVPFGAVGAAAIGQPAQFAAALPNADLYEKRVIAISETLRHVSLKQDNNIGDVLRHLREQNNLLLRLCNDLSDELLSVQTRKEELRLKMESFALSERTNLDNVQPQPQQMHLGMRTTSSISAPVTTNITGGSGCAVHSNV